MTSSEITAGLQQIQRKHGKQYKFSNFTEYWPELLEMSVEVFGRGGGAVESKVSRGKYVRKKKQTVKGIFPCDGCISRCFKRDSMGKKYVLDYAHERPIENCDDRTAPYWERLAG